MNIFFLLLALISFGWADEVEELDKELSISRVLEKNQAKSTQQHFSTYIKTSLQKNEIRKKYCGSPENSFACFEKLRAMKLEELLVIQKMIGHEDIILHDKSGTADIEELLVKEFANNETLKIFSKCSTHAEKQRMPFLVMQMEKKNHFLNGLARSCQKHLTEKKGKLFLGDSELKEANEKLISHLKAHPLSIADSDDQFEKLITSINNAEIGSLFFSTCLENADKVPAVAEIRNIFKKGTFQYSGVTHQVFFFEEIRPDGARNYASTGEKLLGKILLIPANTVAQYRSVAENASKDLKASFDKSAATDYKTLYEEAVKRILASETLSEEFKNDFKNGAIAICFGYWEQPKDEKKDFCPATVERTPAGKEQMIRLDPREWTGFGS